MDLLVPILIILACSGLASWGARKKAETWEKEDGAGKKTSMWMDIAALILSIFIGAAIGHSLWTVVGGMGVGAAGSLASTVVVRYVKKVADSKLVKKPKEQDGNSDN
jgi:hypothetical protein